MVVSRQRLLPLSLTLALCFGCGKRAPSETQQHPAPPAPSLSAPAASLSTPSPAEPREASSLPLVTGSELLAAIRASSAKATVVNAWASWCGPCRREIPMLEAMAVNLRPQGVRFLLVSVDEHEQRPQAEAFLRDHQVKLPSYLAARPLDAFKQALNPRWPGMLPATFLYDAAGKLRYFWGGPAYENEILPIIEGFLAGQHIDGEASFGLAPGAVQH